MNNLNDDKKYEDRMGLGDSKTKFYYFLIYFMNRIFFYWFKGKNKR